jgi:DNA-binding Lrp family transcriptional regulator
MSEIDELRKRILEFLARNGERATGEILAAVKDLGVEREKVHYRLLTLAADGYVERRKITSKLSLWRITEKGKEVLKVHQ